MWRGIIMQKYPFKKQYLSESNIYIAASIKTIFLEHDLIFLYFEPVVPFVMNVLFNSYNVTDIPSLNNSLLDA